MNIFNVRAASVLIMICSGLLLAAGCASTKTSNRKQYATKGIAKPKCIWVYDFAATAADLPVGAVITDLVPKNPKSQTEAHIAQGRKVGAQLAEALVVDIRAMGIHANRGTDVSPIEDNDIVLYGYIISQDEGDKEKRMWVGFGDGASDLKVAVEGFQFTGKGLKKLGSGDLDAEGSKAPGGLMGVATFLVTKNPLGLIVSCAIKMEHEHDGKAKVEGRAEQTAKEISRILKQRFKEQGWIQ